MTSWAGNNNAAGYTLLELLLVLAIVAGLLSLVPPMFGSAINAQEPRTAARQVMAALRYARSEAVSLRQPVAFVLDLDQHRYQVDGRPAVHLPPSLQLSLVTADSEVHGGGRGAIRFFADGSASGGRITVGGTTSRYEVDVAWLTGQVTLLE